MARPAAVEGTGVFPPCSEPIVINVLRTGLVTAMAPGLWEPRKIKNLTLTEACKKTPCGAKGSNKFYIKMTGMTQAASN